MTRRLILMLVLTGLVAGAYAQDAAPPVEEKDQGPGVSVTVYNENFAVVKERRSMTLEKGAGWVKFLDVASRIDPTSVTFASLTDPKGTRVLEQNYEFDLVSAQALLDKYVDKTITVILKDGRLVEGELMSSGGDQLVMKTADGIELVPRDRNVRDIIFSKLPEGLLTKPTLVWKVSADAAGPQLIRVAYMTAGMSWRADYSLLMAEDDDAIDWEGWVTVNNNCGTRFVDAGLKLIAGDVHRVREQLEEEKLGVRPARGSRVMDAAKAIEEKAFSEYHMYSLTAPTTLNNNETKQLEFVTCQKVPVTKKYFYRGSSYYYWSRPTNKVDVEIHFKNDEKSNMGVPLPKGVVRLYKRDAEGEMHLLGSDAIDHTPRDEKMKFQMGNAFDLVGQRKVMAMRRPSLKSMEEDVEITLRNHKKADVTIEVQEVMRYGDWTIYQESMQHVKLNVSTPTWQVPVKANGESKLTYSVRYTWR